MKRALPFAALCTALALFAGATLTAAPSDCEKLRLHGQSVQAQSCYESLVRSSTPYLRAEGDWGLHMYQQANTEFRQAVAQDDTPVRTIGQ